MGIRALGAVGAFVLVATASGRADAGNPWDPVWLRQLALAPDAPSAFVAVDGAGNAFVATTVDDGAGGQDDIEVIKFSGASGASLWSRHYRGAASGQDQAAGIALDPSGNPVVVGRSVGSTGTNDYVTAKYDGATGATLWTARLTGSNDNGDGDDVPATLAVDAVGNVAVTGTSWNGAARGYDFATVKYAGSTGATVWSRRWDNPAGGGNDAANAVGFDGAGDVVVTGTTTSASYANVVTIKYDGSTGASAWSRTLVAPAAAGRPTQGIASNGDVFVATSFASAVDVGFDAPLAARYASATGATIWKQDYTNIMRGTVIGSVVMSAGDFAIETFLPATSNNSNTQAFFINRLAPADGANTDWGGYFVTAGPPNLVTSHDAIAVRASDDVIAIGASAHDRPGWGSSLVKIDGVTDFRAPFFAPGGGVADGGAATSVAFDASGGIFVTAVIHHPAASGPAAATLFTLKYVP